MQTCSVNYETVLYGGTVRGHNKVMKNYQVLHVGFTQSKREDSNKYMNVNFNKILEAEQSEIVDCQQFRKKQPSCLKLTSPRSSVIWKRGTGYILLLCHPPQAEISELQQLLASKDAEIECLQTQLLAKGSTANDNTDRGTHSWQSHPQLPVQMKHVSQQCACLSTQLWLL